MKWGLNAVRRWNTAKRLLNTERSEVLEPHEMGFERRQALEYCIAALEPLNS